MIYFVSRSWLPNFSVSMRRDCMSRASCRSYQEGIDNKVSMIADVATIIFVNFKSFCCGWWQSDKAFDSQPARYFKSHIKDVLQMWRLIVSLINTERGRRFIAKNMATKADE